MPPTLGSLDEDKSCLGVIMQTFRVSKAPRRDYVMCVIASFLLCACLSVELLAGSGASA